MDRLQLARALLLLVLIGQVWTFNVDLNARTLLNSNLSISSGEEELFGFSIAHHRFSDGSQAIYVGAPKAYYDDPEFGVLRTGQVYGCEIVNGAQCQPDPIFQNRTSSVSTSVFQAPPVTLDLENGMLDRQLMGFSVRSFGEDGMIACAPLFLDNLPTGTFNGRCVYLEQDFYSSVIPIQFVEGVFSQPFALAGVDTAFSNTPFPALFIGAIRAGSASNPGIVFGSTIPYGTTTTNNINTLDDAEASYGYHLEKAVYTDAMLGNNIMMSGPTGNDHSGEVVPLAYYGSFDIGVVTDAIVNGPMDQPDSYFGYDFAALQLNKNGYDSIVVGCPLCDRDRGQLFVYLHGGIKQEDADENFVEKLEVNSPNTARGRFGMQVENIGDIDRDGFDDLAVSAPYAGPGVVYVYRGTEDGLSKAYQTIEPSSSIHGFGFVLTGNFDVDNNNYSEFAIGGFPGNQITIMRSSPVVNIEPSFLEESTTAELAVTTTCVVENIQLLCFKITPCFSFSTVEGIVPRFAFNYELKADSVLNRVGLVSNNTLGTNTVTKEYIVTDSYTCEEPYTFALLADFTATEPIPIILTVSDADNPLVVESPQDATFGGSLTPVLNRYIAGSNTQRDLSAIIEISLNRSCGDDGMCIPDFTLDVDHSVSQVYLALRFEFGFNVTVNNSYQGEYSFAPFLDLFVTPGIVLSGFNSITDFAIVGCEMHPNHTSAIRCLLRNPIENGDTVKFQIVLRPDLRTINFNTSSISLNFSIGDGEQDSYDSTSFDIPAISIAGYNLNTAFGENSVQVGVVLPNVNLSAVPVRESGTLVTYSITLSHTYNSSVGSPIPESVATITWPTATRDSEPLLVIVEVTSTSATCQQQDLYPYQLNGLPSFADVEERVPITNCPGDITCGILQCIFLDLPAVSIDSSSATPPLNLLIHAVLYGTSVRGQQNIPVFVSVQSATEYPIIDVLGLTSANTITISPGITEFPQGCTVIPYIITIVVTAVFGLVMVLIVIVGMCGKTGHYYFEHRHEKLITEMRETEHQDVVDGTFGARGTRTIPPPGELDIGTELKKEKADLSKAEEAEMEDIKHSEQLEAVLAPQNMTSAGGGEETEI